MANQLFEHTQYIQKTNIAATFLFFTAPARIGAAEAQSDGRSRVDSAEEETSGCLNFILVVVLIVMDNGEQTFFC